jgi:hypothetical protein
MQMRHLFKGVSDGGLTCTRRPRNHRHFGIFCGVVGDHSRDIRERRRIEIRLRKSAPQRGTVAKSALIPLPAPKLRRRPDPNPASGATGNTATPQEIIALQSEMLRDNIETFLGFARKAGEHSTRFAEEAKRQFVTLAEGRKSA